MPLLQDVGALAGVSSATASRVLSGSLHPVAGHTRQKVLDAAKALDFEPNMLARGLARNHTQTVAVLVHDITDEYFSEIARGAEDEAYRHGYVALICNTDRDADKELYYLRKLRAMQIDAIIFAAGSLRDQTHRRDVNRQLAQIEAASGVIVRLAPHPGGKPDIAYSNRRGLALAVDHLVGLGHCTIGFLAGPRRITTSAERLASMRLALASHGLELAETMIFDGDFSRAGGEQAAAKFVDTDCPASAMVSANDQAAIGFVRGLRSRQVVVPDDVSVVGFDDIAPCAYVEPPLTTVHVPLYELGVHGMQLAFDLLAGKPRPKPREVPLELVIRSTTAPAPRHRRKHGGTS